MKIQILLALNLVSLTLALSAAHPAKADFTVSYLDGGSWNAVYAQGFSPSVAPIPDPGLTAGDQVFLKDFSFYKSGNANSSSNVRLAIIDEIFANIEDMSTTSSYFVGLSDNTIADPGTVATGDPLTFNFSGLSLDYGGDYAAVLVNVNGTDLTPVLVPALVADYIEDPNNPGTFIPETNYGAADQFVYAVSNFITETPLPPPGTAFFNTFSFAADANFTASFGVVPEPATASLVLVMFAVMTTKRNRR